MHPSPKKRSRLTPEDWILAAIEAIRIEGPKGLRVTQLARTLGVSPGSFYWHFRDRDDLRARILEFWMERMIAAAGRAAVQTGKGDSAIRSLGGILADRKLPQFDLVMREWARTDSAVAAAVARADDLRIRRATAMLVEAGFDEGAAGLRARMILWTHRGAGDAAFDERFQVATELLETILRDPKRGTPSAKGRSRPQRPRHPKGKTTRKGKA